MKTIAIPLLASALLLSCSQSTDQGSLRSGIEKSNQEFMKAVAAKDGEAVKRLYTDDARLMFPHAPTIEGKENIKAFFEQTLDAGITGVNLVTEEVAGTDEFAIESGRYEMKAGDKTVDKGRYIVHWKNVDGKWLLHRDMPTSDQPAPQPVAHPDQTVGIAVFKVKKGNGEKFESFFRETLIPAFDTGEPAQDQALKSVRMLRGKASEKDGSEKFMFIFDPLFEGIEYGIEETLVAKHGKEKGKQLFNEFKSITTGFYEFHDMKQLPAFK